MTKKRVAVSVGSSIFNEGVENVVEEKKYEIDSDRAYVILDVVPMGAVRMSSSDRWKTNPNDVKEERRQRPAVTKYFAFKDKLRAECEKENLKIGESLDLVFFIPMPDSWSEKKKQSKNGLPHKSKPDVDNILKGFMDALKKEDGDVWCVKMQKRYAYYGCILVYK